MKKTQTIGEILTYFKGLTFHGVDLSLSLCDQFTVDYVYNTLWTNQNKDWLYRLARMEPIFFYRAKRHHPRMELTIPQAEVLLLSTGVSRNTLLTFHVLDYLAPLTRLVLFTNISVEKEPEKIPFINMVDVPFFFKEWRGTVLSLKDDLEKRLKIFQRDFKPSQLRIYSIFNVLCWSIATVLRAEYLLERAHPKLIFTDMDRQSVDAMIIQVARKMRIPSVTLVHGIRGEGFLSSLWTPLIADNIICWGEWMRKDFTQLGVAEDKISVGGYPRLYPITDDDYRMASKLLTSQGCSMSSHIVLLLSSNLSDDKPSVDLFMSAQNHSPDFYFMIRPHPSENLAWYESHLSDSSQRLQDTRKWSFMQSMAIADVVVGLNSGACIDAIILGKPVILIKDPILDYSASPMLKNAVDRGVILVANDADDLRMKINEAMTKRSEMIQSYASEYADCIGEKAAMRTSSILKSMIFE